MASSAKSNQEMEGFYYYCIKKDCNGKCCDFETLFEHPAIEHSKIPGHAVVQGFRAEK